MHARIEMGVRIATTPIAGHDVVQRRERTVVHEWRRETQAAQRRRFPLPRVLLVLGHARASALGHAVAHADASVVEPVVREQRRRVALPARTLALEDPLA